MTSLTPNELMNNHIKSATYLYGEDYVIDPYYITSQFKELFEIQYSHLLTSLN